MRVLNAPDVLTWSKTNPFDRALGITHGQYGRVVLAPVPNPADLKNGGVWSAVGGKLNYLELRGVKDKSTCKEEARECQRAQRELEKQHIAFEKKNRGTGSGTSADTAQINRQGDKARLTTRPAATIPPSTPAAKSQTTPELRTTTRQQLESAPAPVIQNRERERPVLIK